MMTEFAMLLLKNAEKVTHTLEEQFMLTCIAFVADLTLSRSYVTFIMIIFSVVSYSLQSYKPPTHLIMQRREQMHSDHVESHILIVFYHITSVLALVSRMRLTPRILTSCGLLVLLILGSTAYDSVCQGDKECVYIQGFVPKRNPTFSTEAVIPAAMMAIDDLNNSTKYLPDHELVLDFADTKV